MSTTTLLSLTVIALLVHAAASDTSATGYTNHTVGRPASWFFDAKNNISAINYPLGQGIKRSIWEIVSTVIQTYNESTYNSCSMDDASDDDTFQYNGGSNEFGQKATIAVPLSVTGSNYFFSDAEDGVQCQRGMAFKISVNHGLGLPPSLNQPPPPPYIEPPGPDTAQSPPINIAGGSPAMDNGVSRDFTDMWFLLTVLLVGVTSVSM